MSYNHQSSSKRESKTFEGVVYYLHKMTEGRRLDLRLRIAEPNRRIREILREQGAIEKMDEDKRDEPKWLELQDEFDGLMIEKINPEWIAWGVKKVEGLESDGKPLGVDDWSEWPSAFFAEVLTEIKSESELNGLERKNLPSLLTSGEAAATGPSSSTVPLVDGMDTGKIGIVDRTIPIG